MTDPGRIKTTPTYSTAEVVFWHVLVGVLTVVFLVAMWEVAA